MKEKIIKRNILYVEDDQRVSKIFIELLKSFNLDITHYEYAEDAYNDFKTNTYDLMIVDIELPKQNGLNLISKIRSLNKLIPIIVLSGYDHKEYLKEAIDYQVTKYITKPIDTRVFIPQLFSILDGNNNKIKLSDDVIYFPDEYIVEYRNKKSYLTMSEYIILNCLYNNRGHLVSYEQLINLLNDTTQEILRTHIKNIRKKSSKELIETVPTLGYKLKSS